MDDGWSQTTVDAIEEIHESAPSLEELETWLRNLALFGRFSQASHFPWVCTTLIDDPALEKATLAMLEEACTLALEFFQLGTDYLDGTISRQIFLDKNPDRSLADGELSSAHPPR